MRFASLPTLLALGFLAGCSSDIHDGINMKGKVGFGAVIPCGADQRSGNEYHRLGAEYHRGMLVAENTLNGSGGVEGKQVKVVVYDSAGEPEKGMDATRRLTRDFDVPFLAVAMPRVVDKAVTEYAGHDALTLRMDAGPAPETEAPRALRVFVSAKDEAALIAETAMKESWNTVLVLAVEDRYGEAAADLTRNALKNTATSRVDRLALRRDSLALGAIDEAVRKTAYDAVCIFGNGPEIPPVLRTLRKAGHKGAIIGNHAFGGKTVTSLDRPILRGIRFTAPAFSLGNDTPMSSRFRGEYRELNRDEPDLFSALGYDQVMIVFSAAKAEETFDAEPIRERILADKTFAGAAGTYRFDADGEARLELSLAPVLPPVAATDANPVK